ncbi:MAG TPA: FAD-dependent monooxygenase [Edaphobacter sp.]
MRATDVFVCGGGPAGLAAAIAARLEGFDVVVADCFKPPIDKACGEGLMPDGLTALAALGVSPPEDRSGIFCGIRFLEAGRSVEARFPHGVGRGLRRTTLHEILHRRASDLGVAFRWSTQVLEVSDGLVRTGEEQIQAKWVIGADGIHSRIRERLGLGRGRGLGRRIGLRQHFRVRPWSEFMEIHWSDWGQAYVTPIGPAEICVVVVGRVRVRSVEASLSWFPELAARLRDAEMENSQRGAITEGRSYDRVTSGCTALVGDASGSVDAIAGQGLTLSFLQSRELATALRRGDLNLYEKAHRRIRRVPMFMSRSMLLMDRFGPVRHWMQRVFHRDPQIFEQMLAVHVGVSPLTVLGSGGILSLVQQILVAQGV